MRIKGFITSEQAEELCATKHKGVYTYSFPDKVRLRDKITVICCKHGEFTLLLSSHLTKGKKCPKCVKTPPRLRVDKKIRVKEKFEEVELWEPSNTYEIFCYKPGHFYESLEQRENRSKWRCLKAFFSKKKRVLLTPFLKIKSKFSLSK